MPAVNGRPRYTGLEVPRTLVIGDVHGCSDELAELVRTFERGPDDAIVLVGDLVAKGPDSRGVLAFVRELGARSVLGNHDARVLHHRQALEAGHRPRPLGPDHAVLLEQFDAADFALLASLPLWLRLPEHGALVVHAGCLPGVPLEQQDPELLLNMRTIRPDGSGSRKPHDGVLWASLWPGPEFVLFGHHAAQGLQRHPYALGLDTGCVYGHRLTGCVLPERRLISVAARRTYAKVKD